MSAIGRLLLIAIVLAAAIAPARADILVLEAYEGRRPSGAESIEPFLSQLEKLGTGYVARPQALRDRLGVRLPLPGSDPTLTGAGYAKTLNLADATWLKQPPLAELIPQLNDAVEVGKRNPVFLVADPNRREVFRSVLLALAIALHRNGNIKESEEAMAEWIRTFPGEIITRAHDGTDAEELYIATRKALAKRGRGTLTIKVSDASAQLYVNEVIRPSGVPIVDLMPGLYRVLVMDQFNSARRWLVEVLPNQDPVLTIDWAIASALNITSTYAALELSTTSAFLQAGRSASRFAESTLGTSAVVLVGMTKLDHGQAIVTATLNTAKQAKPTRRASVRLGTESVRNLGYLTALARFIALGEANTDLTQVFRSDEATALVPPRVASPSAAADSSAAAADSGTAAQVSAASAPRPSYVVPVLVVSSGLAAIASGLYWRSTHTIEENYPALGLAVVGAAVTGIGIGMIIDTANPSWLMPPRVSNTQRTTMIGLSPLANGGGAITLGGAF